ncbi:type II toxin-antitoxin system RelB family antitoxin [Lactovum odontotermitis]
MTVTSVRLNDAEYKVMKQFADLHGKSLSTMLKEALEAQIEDDFDLQLAERSLREDDGTRLSISEMREKYGL